MAERFEALAEQIRACRVCETHLEHGCRPILQGASGARLQIISQAPGMQAHLKGLPFKDPSGNRLRDWLGIGEDEFYDPQKLAITPMGFCFPGYDAKGGDRPPCRECAPLWQDRVRQSLTRVQTTLLVGAYAQKRYLGPRASKTLTETVLRWREFWPRYVALPHPSWRNTAWLKRNPWFEKEVLPALKLRVREIFDGGV